MKRRNYDTIIEGIGGLPEGTYTNILVDGMSTVKGAITFQHLQVNGTMKADHDMTGEEMHIDGTLKINGRVKVKTLNVDGMMTSTAGTVYADLIDIDGMLKSKEEVSADRIIVDGCIQAPLLSGDEIDLNYRDMKAFSFMTNLFGINHLIPGVDQIECTRLKASHIECKRICAQEIVLSDYCMVDVVECEGSIYLDRTCKIKEIKGSCQVYSS